MVGQKDFIEIPELSMKLENLYSFQFNRQKYKIILISSEPMSICSAMNQGYCVIPVTQFNKEDQFDF
jgi:hypothetical protein